MSRIKPILALKCPREMPFEIFISKIQMPVLATPKIDFIRCYTTGTKEQHQTCNSYTRSRNLIPNHFIRRSIDSQCPPYLDGELGVGKTFQDGTSGIMSYEGKPNFTYYVFDCCINGPLSYLVRTERLGQMDLPKFCTKLIPQFIFNHIQLLDYEQEQLSKGAEGICVRPVHSRYVVGTADNRATFSKPNLIAITRWEHSEARVVDFVEALQNTNEPELDRYGRQKRSSNKEGMIPLGYLGSLTVEDLYTKEIFNIGSGFTLEQRKDIWNNQEKWLGKLVRYKWKKHGTLNKPRTPIFEGERDKRDL